MLGLGQLACAAFFAGVLNTVAGAGTFLTLPALVFVGVPVVMANATSAVAVAPDYLGGAAGFRHEIAALPRDRLVGTAAAILLNGSIGSWLLPTSSNQAFRSRFPFCR